MHQPKPPPSLLSRLARLAGLALLFTSACTIEHMEVGLDRDGLGEQTTDGNSTSAPECPDECAVDTICRLCDDDSCAEPEVTCNADGSCGEVDWVCPGGPIDPGGPGQPACPDVCDAVCNGEPEPTVPEGCPVPECECEPEPTCECEVPAICEACPDGSCANPQVKCDADGSCAGVSWVCGDPGIPGCPDPEFLCQVQCKGDVLDVPPDCPVTNCECEPEPTTCECAVPDICMLCDDGTCAEPTVACGEDGKCGEILWTCKPVEPTPTCDCAIDLICKVCDDGSCAEGIPQCNPDGSCAEPAWQCPNEPKLYDCDTNQVACDLAVECDAGLVPTQNGDCYGPCVKPEQCAPQTYDCDLDKVLCKRAQPECKPGLVPSRADDCYGPCVSPELCQAPTGVCPEECPVIDICKLCPDGSCAAAAVSCTDDGSCGQTSWVCSEMTTPEECAKLCAAEATDDPAVDQCACESQTDPECPDVCAALCAGDPTPDVPVNCPVPSCVCPE